MRRAPASPGECSVLCRSAGRRAGWISRVLALPSENAQRQQRVGCVKAICRFIEQHLDEPITLQRLGEEFHQSPFHLQRRFKGVLGITPREYADSCRLRTLKHNLQAGDSVTRAMYDAGYGSSSRLYERTASQLGMTPDKYRRGAIAASIRYACSDSPLGRMLIAATERGVCSIQFGRTDGELLEGLRREFPFASRKSDEADLRAWAKSLLQTMRGKDVDSGLPLDIRATAFQRRVWTYLQSIPVRARRSPISRSQRRLDGPRLAGQWHAPALRIRWRSRSLAIAWFAEMAPWADIAGEFNERRPCLRWNSRHRGKAFIRVDRALLPACLQHHKTSEQECPLHTIPAWAVDRRSRRCWALSMMVSFAQPASSQTRWPP